MKRLILLMLLIGLVTMAARTSYACWCIKPDAAEAFAQAGAVFVGQVLDITEPATTKLDAPLPGPFFVIKFKIEKSWKGAEFKRELSVLTAQGKYGCFAHLPVSKGERYLVYANPANGWLSISACSRTALITDPIAPAATLPTKTEGPTPRKNYLSPQLALNDVNVAADLRLLESPLFPTSQFKYKLSREVDRWPLLNFTEPGLNVKN